MSKGEVRKIDYSNPAQVKESPIKPGSSEDMPGEFRDAVKRIQTIYDIPAAAGGVAVKGGSECGIGAGSAENGGAKIKPVGAAEPGEHLTA